MARKTLYVITLLVLNAVWPLGQANAASPFPGAIFTTGVDGTIVNANQYASKCDVYLNGGPGRNAPAGAAGLPAGDYFFQVTDPSGQVLLNTDPVQNRRFHVSAAGVIDLYTGTGGLPHPTGFDQIHPELGSSTVRLANSSCPADFLDSPNDSGVYKVWVTPVAALVGDPAKVDNPCGSGCFHGFLPSASKTDNFKVRPTLATFSIKVIKELVDINGNVSVISGWPVSITDSVGGTVDRFTSSDNEPTADSFKAGTYTVTEGYRSGYQIDALRVNGVSLPPQSIYSFLWTEKSPNPFVIVFRNKIVDTGDR
jgi:hypothetical protein